MSDSPLVPVSPAAVAIFQEKVNLNLAYLAPLVGGALTADAADTIRVRLADWFTRFGVTESDVTAACRALADPGVLGQVWNDKQLLAAFAREVDRAKAKRLRRAADEDAARLAEERRNTPTERGPGFTDEQRRKWKDARGWSDEVLDLLNGIGTPIGGRRDRRRGLSRGERNGDQAEEGAGPQAGEGHEGQGGEPAGEAAGRGEEAGDAGEA